MITKEAIKSEVERVPDERLEELYRIVKAFAASRPQSAEPSLMPKLRQIRISRPADFSENIDLYLTGEQTID
ncbi:hypothetical protein BH18ACI2_BH18ACI2_20740 [soil metagenome]